MIKFFPWSCSHIVYETVVNTKSSRIYADIASGTEPYCLGLALRTFFRRGRLREAEDSELFELVRKSARVVVPTFRLTAWTRWWPESKWGPNCERENQHGAPLASALGRMEVREKRAFPVHSPDDPCDAYHMTHNDKVRLSIGLFTFLSERASSPRAGFPEHSYSSSIPFARLINIRNSE